MANASTPLVRYQKVTLARPGQAPLLTALDWTWLPGEAWWVEGPPASGKTTFCESLLGHHIAQQGTRHWPLATQQGREPWQVLRWVPWLENSRRFQLGDYFHQQRWHAAESQDGPSVREFAGESPAAREALEALELSGRLDQPLVTLSSGQMRRARLARALGEQPAGLVVEEPFAGLDSAQRGRLEALLQRRVTAGMGLVIAGREGDGPNWITKRLALGPAQPTTPGEKPHYPLPEATGEAPVLEFHHLHLAPGGKPLFTDFTWVIRRGERWGLLGENGSGKSTLMALAAGDHPQVYAQDVRLFGARRGTGESIWDLKKRMGQVAPEIQTYARHHLTLAQMVATGITDRFVPGGITDEQQAAIRALLAELGLADLADRPYPQAPTGAQRLVWLARALAKGPELLLLDEPFQGMDSLSIALGRAALSRRLRPETTLVMSTHDPAELPGGITRFMRLGTSPA
ncbi:MAG: ATP-binding cassette domain-containing protein [Gemmataceae bacterium]